jgi:hypothetical protein
MDRMDRVSAVAADAERFVGTATTSRGGGHIVRPRGRNPSR